jgi:hypothetical protein
MRRAAKYWPFLNLRFWVTAVTAVGPRLPRPLNPQLRALFIRNLWLQSMRWEYPYQPEFFNP